MNSPDVTPLSCDELTLLGAFMVVQRPIPLGVVLSVVNPIPSGWAKLRMFTAQSPWHARTRTFVAVADELADRGLLNRTCSRRLPLGSEYEATNLGWWTAVFQPTGDNRNGATT